MACRSSTSETWSWSCGHRRIPPIPKGPRAAHFPPAVDSNRGFRGRNSDSRRVIRWTAGFHTHGDLLATGDSDRSSWASVGPSTTSLQFRGGYAHVNRYICNLAGDLAVGFSGVPRGRSSDPFVVAGRSDRSDHPLRTRQPLIGSRAVG